MLKGGIPMKTIQQLAYELNVSKTAIRKHIRKLNIEHQLVKKGNRFLIDEHQEYLIRMSFTETEKEPGSRTENNDVSDIVRVLEKQLDEKQRTIDSLQKLLDQEQQLHLLTQQKLLALEDKTAEQKPGFWARLFGKE